MARSRGFPRPLPGFGLSLGITATWFGLLAALPLLALLWRSAALGRDGWVATLTDARVLASLRLSLGAAVLAAALDTLAGLAIAWTLTRNRVPGRALWDAAVDLPFALPTAVAGIALCAVWSPDGWLGRLAAPVFGQIAFAPPGIVLAMAFVGLPFVVRTVQPVLEDADRDLEAAAESLGASPWQVWWRVTLPGLRTSLTTGFALSFARAIGEYGSAIFVSGNIPLRTEITPLLIVSRLEEYDYVGATALAVLMLAASTLLLLTIALLGRRARRVEV